MGTRALTPYSLMELALEEASRACEFNKVGAILTAGDRIIGRGHSTFPPWFNIRAKYAENSELFVSGATLEAYLSTGRKRLDGCTLYVTTFPTNMCAKTILQVGVREIFYEKYGDENQTDIKAALKMFEEANYKFSNGYIYKQPKFN